MFETRTCKPQDLDLFIYFAVIHTRAPLNLDELLISSKLYPKVLDHMQSSKPCVLITLQ